MPAPAIVGPARDDAGLADHILMVLQHRGRTAGFCTGIVMAPTAVLTAAHCAPPGAELRIHFPDPGHAPVLLPVSAVVRHPQYRPDAIRTRQRSIDLALLRLPAPLPDRFKPARFGTTAAAAAGDAFTVSGFGVTREDEARSSGRLAATILAAQAPLSSVLLWMRGPDGQLAGACTGDSGGPVLDASGAVVALTVWASGQAGRHCGDLTQALWLSPHQTWIAETLAQWSVMPRR